MSRSAHSRTASRMASGRMTITARSTGGSMARDRGHRFVTEYRAAPGIDRHDPSAITGLTQQLHDGAARRRGALAGADHGDAAGCEERREVADGIVMAVSFAAQAKRENKMADPIELLIQGRAHELGPGFAVRRVLPSVKRRMVGPFIFLDHFGPMVVPPGGDGMEVRPHPHIGLATVTYLFDGGIFHRDSLGYAQAIRPGDVNWMTRRRAASPTASAPSRRCAAPAFACMASRPGWRCPGATRRRRRPSSMSRRRSCRHGRTAARRSG